VAVRRDFCGVEKIGGKLHMLSMAYIFLFLNNKVLGQIQVLHMCVCDLHLSVPTNRFAFGHVSRTLLVVHLHVCETGILEFLGQISHTGDNQAVPDCSEFYTIKEWCSVVLSAHRTPGHSLGVSKLASNVPGSIAVLYR